MVKPSIGNQADVDNDKTKKVKEAKEQRKSVAKRRRDEKKGPEGGKREAKRTRA